MKKTSTFRLGKRLFMSTVVFTGGANYDSIKVEEIINDDFNGKAVRHIATFTSTPDREFYLWLRGRI